MQRYRLSFTTWLLASLAASCVDPGSRASAQPAAVSCPEITGVSIVSRVGDSGIARAGRKFVKSGEKVTLYAVVETAMGGKKTVYTNALLKRKGALSPERWPGTCPATVNWYKVEAREESYDNSYSAPPAHIEYEETAWETGWSVTADVHPTIMRDEFPELSHGLGVMRYKVQAATASSSASSPGVECRESGAACRKIHTVAYRRDDSYLGYLYELYNTPYIYGSKRIKGGHQSDLLVGSDCADLMVYGKRRQRGKKKFGYTYTGGLYKLAAKRWTKVTLDSEGFYLDRKGKRFTFGPKGRVRPGDLINFHGGHVGALVRDDGDGFLDTEDYVMHTFVRAPETVPIKESRWWGIDGKEILRLKD